jgi:hypothetical protein
MIELKAKIRAWGGSWGATLSKEELQRAHYKPGDDIRLLVVPKSNPIKESFGKLKLKRPVAQLMKEIDEEMDYE